MNQSLISNVKHKIPSLKSSYLWNSFQAQWHHYFGRTDEAIHNWLDLLNQGSPKSRLKVVRYLIEAQAFQEARDYLERQESKQNDESAEINYLLARCYIGQALIPLAKKKIEQAIQVKPQNSIYWDLLADCYLELGDWREAIIALNNSLRAAPKHAEINYRLGIIYAFHDLYQEALNVFSGMLPSSTTQKPSNWEMKAEMHLRLKQLS